jgi:hypothetical protein
MNTYKDLTPEQLETVLIVRSKSTGQSKKVTVRELLGIIAIYLQIFDNLNNQANQMKRFITKELEALNNFKEIILKVEPKKMLKNLEIQPEDAGLDLDVELVKEPFRFRRLDDYDTSSIENIPHVPVADTIMDKLESCSDFGLFDVCVSDIIPIGPISWLLDTLLNGLIKYTLQPIWSGLLIVYRGLRAAFEEIYRVLTSIVDAIVNFFTSIPDWFMDGWNAFLDFFTRVGDMFKQGFDEVVGFLTDIGNYIVDGIQKIIRPYKVIFNTFKTLYNLIYHFATEVAPNFIKKMVNTVKDFIFNVLLETLMQTTENLKVAVGFVVKNLQEGFAVLMDQIDNLKDIFLGGFGNIKNSLEKVIDTMMEATDTLKDTLVDNIGQSMTKNFGNITDSIDYVKNSAEYGLSGLTNVLKDQPNKINRTIDSVQDTFSKMADEGKTIVQNFGDRVQNSALNSFDSTKQLVLSRGQQSFDIAKSGFDDLVDLINNQVAQELQNSLTRAKTEGGATFDQVQGSFKDLANNAQTELSDVFSQGINKVKTTFETKLPGIMSGVSDSVMENINRSLTSLNDNVVARTEQSVNNTINILQDGVKDFSNVLEKEVAASFTKGFDKLQRGSQETVQTLQGSFQDIAQSVQKELGDVFNQGLNKVTTTFETKVPGILKGTVDESVDSIERSVDIFTDNVLDKSKRTAQFLKDSSEAGVAMVKQKTMETVQQAYDAFWQIWQPLIDFFNSYGRAAWDTILYLSTIPDKLETYKRYIILFIIYLVIVKAMDWYVGHLGYQFDAFGKPYSSL